MTRGVRYPSFEQQGPGADPELRGSTSCQAII